MPRGDGTGPQGLGPMTGRTAGYCAGFQSPGYIMSGFYRGIGGRGHGAYGRGRGRRNWYYATGLTGWQRAAIGFPYGTIHPVNPAMAVQPITGLTQQQELSVLRNQTEYLENTLNEMRKRIADLESTNAQ